MAFKDIAGQERAVDFFRNAVNQQRLAHAYLFLGPEGVGKTLFAQTLAKFLNCENPFKEGSSLSDCCDNCLSCHKVDNFNHPDVHWIAPNESAQISIDEIRLVQKEISLKPYEGRYKVFIILEAEYLTEEAANSLLKTLEEPPSFSLIILTSPNTSGLSATIISRSQLIKFYPLPYERLKEILLQRYKVEAKEVHFLTAQAEGRLGQALRLKEEDALNKKNYLIDRVRQFKRGVSFLDLFDLKDKKELTNQMSHLLFWFRDILVMKLGLAASSIINLDRMQVLKTEAGQYQLGDLEQIIMQINQTQRLLEQNVNPKVALEVMLRRISRCRK